MRRLRWISAGLTVLAMACVVGGVVLLTAYRTHAGLVWSFGWLAVVAMTMTLLGLIITWKVPGNPVGPLLTWVGAVAAFLAARPAYETVALTHPGSLPLDLRVVVVFEESSWWMWVAAALLLLYFPDGHVPGPRWRWMPYAIVSAAAAQQAYGVVESDPLLPPLQHLRRPFATPPLSIQIVGVGAFFAMLILVLVCLASLVVRYRRSTGVRRAQMKWLSLAGVTIVLYPAVSLVEILITGHNGPIAVVMGVVTLVSLPASVAVGMLRHDLYDVDRALAAAITYAIATVMLVTVFATATVSAGLLFGRDSAVTAAVATAICAAALAPLRGRVQRLVDARFYPPRRAVALAIEALQQRIYAGVAQPEELEASLRTALRDGSLSIGMQLPGARHLIDMAGNRIKGGHTVPVLLGGEQVGVLICAEEADTSLLRSIAPMAASLIHVMRLRAELAVALREVNDSRTRIVHAGIAERSRLERDLHDGAQQRLVSLGMAMRIAQIQMNTDEVDVDAVLERAVAELATAIAELRQIAHGLRPTSLDDGLAVALAGVTRAFPMPVHLDIDIDELPDHLATTAFYVACEAVTNAAKHAGAGQVTVRVVRTVDTVSIRVSDDGCGGAAARPGSGLAGLVDRVAALGGSLAHAQSGWLRHCHRGGAAVRIVIGEDSTLFREGLASLLTLAGHEIAGRAADAPTLVALVDELDPDLAVIDIRMPPDLTDDGARAARQIRAARPSLGIVLLSQHIETRHAVDLVATGGFGYLLKDRVLDVEDFVDALTRVAGGGSALDPEVVSRLIGRNRSDDPMSRLTPREREVLAMMAEGR